jgi:hypothetical protein
MNTNQGVNPNETSFVLTSAFRSCKKKILKKNFANDKITIDERENFQNCIVKFITVSEHSYAGLRESFLIDLPK